MQTADVANVKSSPSQDREGIYDSEPMSREPLLQQQSKKICCFIKNTLEEFLKINFLT